MQALSTIQVAGLTQSQPSSGSVALVKQSGQRLPVDVVLTLGTLMVQAQARYPNQALPDETPDLYLAEWERLTQRYGLDVFRDGLSKAVEMSRFFPDPRDIAEQCAGLARTKRERTTVADYIAVMDAAKLQCAREVLEDEAAGIMRKIGPDLQQVVDRMRSELNEARAA